MDPNEIHDIFLIHKNHEMKLVDFLDNLVQIS